MAKKYPKKEPTPPATGKNSKGKAAEPPAPEKKSKKGKNSKEPEPQNDRPAHPIVRPSSGKTPISLLHEHAQRIKWERVEYDMMKVKDGMVATAILGWIEPKTKEKITVKYPHSLPAKETPIEARYYAATAALHRVCFNKSLHMVLPREFKDAWGILEDDRKKMLKENPTKHNRIYANDPFKVVLEERKLKEAKQKEEQVRLNNEAKAMKIPVVLTSVKKTTETPTEKKGAKRTATSLQTERHVKFPKKVWDSALSFRFSIKQRDMIQQSIRHHITWKLASEPHLGSITKLLSSIGFRESHIQEALKFQDPLSYLLFNVPDDDLPPYFSDPSVHDTVTVADKNEIIVKRVTEFGVSRSEAIVSLNDNKIDLTRAIVSLTCKYSDHTQDTSHDGQDSQEIWNEEIESLSMIYDSSQIKRLGDSSVTVQFNDILRVTVYKPDAYPYQLAGFVISTVDKNTKLPNYVKLKIISKLAQYTIQNFIGDSYIFSVVDWLQQNCDEIIENPGNLLENPNAIVEGVDDLDIVSSNGKGRRVFRSNPDVRFIKDDYSKRGQSQAMEVMREERSKLPAWSEKANLLKVINSHRISLITGETGSGKSTQLVQFILDDLYFKGNYKTQILCTQPRRISAIGLAERVADERVTKCGEEVGYIIRGANKSNKNTRIKFLTTGILVKFLQSGDEFLNDSILVIDEVHERSMETDLIIIMIKRLLSKYKKLKIVLMSATVDTSVFKSYFPEIDTAHIKGRTFPIQDYYLDDVLEKTQFQIQINDEWIRPKPGSNFFTSGRVNYDLIAELVIKIDEDLEKASNKGSILIFLPGVAEINTCIRTIQQKFKKQSVIFPLHSALTPQDQHRVFATYAPKRKIIVSTNIAETSITINDCVATIDSGKVKSMSYNAIDNTTRLVEGFESKAEAKQRRGRAGRVSEGVSYKLFTKETYESMIDSPVPEIKRINLNSLYLVVKTIGVKDVIAFLNSGIDPPPRDALVKSEELLKCARLIDEYGELTELGKFVSLLPIIDPKHGILLIYSIIFGCTDFGILVASVLGSGTPFIQSQENRDKIKSVLLQNRGVGDLISSVLIVERYFSLESSHEKKKYIQENCLSFTKLGEIKSAKIQYISILEDIGFIPLKYRDGDANLNRNGKNINVVRSIITGAFYPQVARVQLPDPKFFNTSAGSIQVDHDAKLIKYWIRNEEYITQVSQSKGESDITVDKLPATRAFIHPSSVLFDTSSKELSQSQIQELQLEEKGSEKIEKLQQREVNLAPKSSNSKTKPLSSSFVVYNSSTITSKLFLREITPTTTLSTLLFGGNFTYDLSSISAGKQSPGIVLDSWLPIKTWSKNAVLVKELRTLLDKAVKDKLENPSYNEDHTASQESDDVLQLVDSLLESEHS
jgi:HrpA-like RNA helicase